MKYALALLAFLFCSVAQAQDAMVVQTCGTLPLAYAPGATRLLTVDINGKLCGSGGGGGGSPGGSPNQVQYNQAGSFGGFTFSGDGTLVVGTGVFSLKNTGPGATGPIGSGTATPVVTIDAQGRVTALTSATITPPESAITFTDITTNDVSITKHGFAPKAPNDSTKFLNGVGAYSVPAGGSGTVTSVATGCGATGGTITISGTISAASTLRANTGTTDTIANTDCGNVITESNAASIAVALPVASTSGFGAGTFFQVCNIGVGVATVTPTTSQIGGASSKAIQGGTATNPSCLAFQSDGTNYNIVALPVPAGLFTVTGALKGSGAGVVSPAACSDLSNGTALCSTTPGTGVATAAAATLSSAGGLTSTIAAGTSALGTGAITSATCATVVTTTATNTATTDVVLASFNGDPTAVTGYVPLTTGMLTIIPYPTSGNVNFKVCNNTAGSITPGAITLNWRVVR